MNEDIFTKAQELKNRIKTIDKELCVIKRMYDYDRFEMHASDSFGGEVWTVSEETACMILETAENTLKEQKEKLQKEFDEL